MIHGLFIYARNGKTKTTCLLNFLQFDIESVFLKLIWALLIYKFLQEIYLK